METTMQAGGRDYRRQTNIGEALSQFFKNYINFEGRSNRGEFWWAVLGIVLISVALTVIDMITGIPILGTIWSLATLVPGIAIGVRRLHDIGKSGWWYLLMFVPLIGALVLLWWFCQPPQDGPNTWG